MHTPTTMEPPPPPHQPQPPIRVPPGRKLPHQYDNPLTSTLLDCMEFAYPTLVSMGVTATGLTLISGILQAGSIFLLWKGYYGFAAFSYILGGMADEVDGWFARMSNSVSDVGDWLDHGKDLVVHIGLLATIILLPGLPVPWKVAYVLIGAVLAVLSTMHLACQEVLYDRPSEGVAITWVRDLGTCEYAPSSRRFHTAIRWLRFAGTGTVFVVIAIGMLSLRWLVRPPPGATP